MFGPEIPTIPFDHFCLFVLATANTACFMLFGVGNVTPRSSQWKAHAVASVPKKLHRMLPLALQECRFCNNEVCLGVLGGLKATKAPGTMSRAATDRQCCETKAASWLWG